MFTILNFSIRHRGATLYDVKLGDSTKSQRTRLLTTLIIGENGSGKSFLLAQLVDFFRALHATLDLQKTNVESSKYEFVQVVYEYKGNKYSVAREGRTWSIFKNDIPGRLNDVDFPPSVIALSFMTNDKFTFSSEDDPFYKYIGVRASSNSSYTSSVQKRVAASLLQCLRSPQKRNSLNGIIDFLGYQKKIRLEYNLLRKTLFTRPITPSIIKRKIDELQKQNRYLAESRVRDLTDNVDNILSFVQASKANLDKTNKQKLTYEFNLINDVNLDSLVDTELLRYLEELRFISPPQVVLTKTDHFGFENASSGEKHFLFTMLNLAASISENSLVLIDEPELSLHPSWQMKYIKYLKDMLENHKDSHCILATHSHFMVSDLERESSNLIILRGNASLVKPRLAEYVDYSTFAWSAENILYKVFQLRTARNFYFGQEVGELLTMISENSSNLDRMMELIKKFQSMSFDKHDPINEVILRAKQHVGARAND